MKTKKAIILGVISLAVFAFAQINIAFADPTTTQPAGSTSDAIQDSFDVRKYLNIGGDPEKKAEDAARFNATEVKQGESYFDKAKEMTNASGQSVSPVAAFVVTVIDFLVALIGSVSLLIFIVGALLTIVSEGQEDRVSKGKQAMLYSIIGLVLALAAYLIATFVQSIFY